MIKAIFYARFHPSKGPIIAHQVPEGSIISPETAAINTEQAILQSPPSSAANGTSNGKVTQPSPAKPLLDFPLLSPYLIPPQSLCNRLVTLRSPTSPHLIISHPVCIVDGSRYERNEFIFNFGIVIATDRASKRSSSSGGDKASGMVDVYKGIVRKVAGVLRGLEVQSGWLAADEREDEARAKRRERLNAARRRENESGWEVLETQSRVYALCEMILEDLNCYGECMIPIDEVTTLSLRILPLPPQPPHVSSYHVPVLLIAPSSLQTSTWDLALQHLLPHMNGVNSVSRIANLADAEVALACEAVRQLVRHGCAILLDTFSFGASYAVTPQVGEALVRDSAVQDEGAGYVAYPGQKVSADRLVRLLCSFKQGVRLREWCIDRVDELEGIDVRRLVTFGVIKGILYRVRKFAVPGAGGGVDAKKAEAARDGDAPLLKEEELRQLGQYVDGRHCFDQICTEMEMSEKDVMAALRGQDIQVIYR